MSSEKYAKKTQANDDERELLGYVREVHEAIRRELKQNIEKAGERTVSSKQPVARGGLPGLSGSLPGFGGIPGVDLKQSIVKSPAAVLGSGIFASKLSAGDIDMKTMSNRVLHPTVSQYYLVKRDMDTHPHPFEVWHPAYFGSDYIRFRSKHSSHAVRIMDMIEDQRAVGVKYRKKHGIKRVINVPPWDVPLVQSTADKKADYREKVLEMESFVDDNYNPYARHRSRNPKLGLVGNTSAILLQQMRSLSRAETAPVKKYRTDIIGKISILSMKVEGLPSMHLFKRNSLFVMCTCGEFRCTTEIHENAGSQAQWEDLKYWNMSLFRGGKLQLCVYSGDAYDHKLVGMFDIKTEDVVNRPYVFKVNWEEQYENDHGDTKELADIKRVKISDRDSSYGFVFRGGPDPDDLDDLDEANRNIACIESSIYNLSKDNMPKGSVKIVFSMEKGNPWDWKLREYRDIERKKAKIRAKKKEEKRLRLLRARSLHDVALKKEDDENEEEDPNAPKVLMPLKIPYEAIVSKVSLFDLDLDKLKLSNISKCMFHLVAYCGDNQERTTASLHSNETIVDLHGNILSGHIALTEHAIADDAAHDEENLKLGMGEVSDAFKYNVNVDQNYVTIEWDDLLWTMFAGNPDDELILELVVFQPVDAHHLIMLHQKDEVSETLKDGKLVRDTAKKTQSKVLLRRVLGKYRLSAENWMRQPRNGAGITTLLGKLFTSEDETGADIGTAGYGGAVAAGIDMTAEEAEEAREQGRRIRFKDQNPDDFLCKIRIITELSTVDYVDEEEKLVEYHEVESEALDLMRQNSAREPMEESSEVTSAATTPRVPHFTVKQVLGGGNNFMSHDPSILTYPFNVKVLSVAVYDMPSVHRFSRNAPCVRMRCNDWMDTTTVESGCYVSDNGKSAQWDDLHWNFIVHKGNTVRITIYSGLVTIGELVLNTADVPEIKSKGIKSISGEVATGEVVDFLRNNPIDMHGVMEISKSLVLYTRNQEDVVSPSKSRLVVGTEALTPIPSDVQKFRGKIRLKLKIVPHETHLDPETGLTDTIESMHVQEASSVLSVPVSSPNPKNSAPLLRVPQSSIRVHQKYNARLLMNKLAPATLTHPYRLKIIDATVTSLRPPPERQVAPWLYPDYDEITSKAHSRESPLKKSSVDFDGYVMGNSMAVTAATVMNPKRGYWGSNVNLQVDYFLHHLRDSDIPSKTPTVNLERWSEHTFSGYDVFDFANIEHDNKSRFEVGEDYAIFNELNWMVDNIVPAGLSVDDEVVSDVASMIQISVVRKCASENTKTQLKSLEKAIVKGAIAERDQIITDKASRSISDEAAVVKINSNSNSSVDKVPPLENVIVVGYCYVSIKKLFEMSYDVNGVTEFVSPLYIPSVSFPGAKGPDVAKWKRRYPDARQQYPTLKKTQDIVSQISVANIVSDNEFVENRNGDELDAHTSIFSEESQYFSLPGAESGGIGRHKVKPAAMEMAGNIKLRVQFLPHADDDPITTSNPEYNFNFNNAIIAAEQSIVSSHKDDIAMQLTNTDPNSSMSSATLPVVPQSAYVQKDASAPVRSSNIVYSQPRDIDYPFLTVMYSIILTNLRSVHALAGNTPCVKAFLGNRWRKSTDILEKSNTRDGNGYRWENLNWTLLMCHDYDLVHFKVTSGTILVGEYRLAAEPILRKCPYGKYGISELNGVLLDGSNSFAGNIKLILRNEAVHPTNILGRRILSQLQKSGYQFPEENANCALAIRMREASMGWTGMPHKPKDPTRSYDENGVDLGPKVNLGIDEFFASYPRPLVEDDVGTAVSGTGTLEDSAGAGTYAPEDNRLNTRVITADSEGDLLRAWSEEGKEEKLGNFAAGGGTGENGVSQAFIEQLVDHRNYSNNNETINKNHLNYHEIIANAVAAKTGTIGFDDSVSVLDNGSVASSQIDNNDDLNSMEDEVSERSSVWRGRKIRENERQTELISAGKYFGQDNNLRTINYITIKTIKVLDFDVVARNAEVQIEEGGSYEGLASQAAPSGLSVKLLSSVSSVVKKYQDAGNRVFVRVQCGDMWMEQTIPIDQKQDQYQSVRGKKRTLSTDASSTAPLLWSELELPEIVIEDKWTKLDFQILAFGTYACLGRFKCTIQDITSIPRDNNGGITLFGDITEDVAPPVSDRNLGYDLINKARSSDDSLRDPPVPTKKTFNFLSHAISANNNAVPASPAPSLTSGTSTFVTNSRKNVEPVKKIVGKLVLSMRWNTMQVPIKPVDVVKNSDLSANIESNGGESSLDSLNEYSSAAIDSVPLHHPPTGEPPTKEISVQGRPDSSAASLLLHRLSHCDDYHIPHRCPIRLSIYSMFVSSIPDAFVYTGTNAPLALPFQPGAAGPKAVMFGGAGHQIGVDLVTSGGTVSPATFVLTITSGLSNAILFQSSVCRSTISNSGVDEVGGTTNMLFWRNLDISLLTNNESDYIVINLHQCRANDITKNRPFTSASRPSTAASDLSEDEDRSIVTDAIGTVNLYGSDLRSLPRDSRGVTELNLQLFHPTITVNATTVSQKMGYGNSKDKKSKQKLLVGELKLYCFCQSGDSVTESRWRDQIKKSGRTRELLRTAEELLKIDEEATVISESTGVDSKKSKNSHRSKRSKHHHHKRHKGERFDESAMGVVKISSISLVDLPRIHKYFNNAPNVSLNCGAWHMSTEVGCYF